jgi:aryl-phospho-beta-D-glucosidase BglC (GH1 family)
MLHCLSPEILPIYNSFEFKKTNDAANYGTVISKFDEYFIPKQNKVFDQHMFFSRNQKTGESIDEYVKELLLALLCEFGKLVDTLIRGRLFAE